jgi:tetratricopeptide (TPR) repeat protein
VFAAALALAPLSAAAQTRADEAASFEPRAVSAPAQSQYDAARAAYAAGRYRHASALLGSALALDPAGTNLWFNLGVVLERLGELDRAIAAYQSYAARVDDPAERARTARIVARLQGARGELAALRPRRGDADGAFFVVTGAALATTALGVTWLATDNAPGLDPVPIAFTSAGIALGVFATVLYFAREAPRASTYFVSARALPGGGALGLGGRF